MISLRSLSSLLLTCHILATQASPTLNTRASQFEYLKISLARKPVDAFANAAALKNTEHYVELTRRDGSQRSSAALEKIRKAINTQKRDVTADQPLKSVLGGAEYITDIKFGTETVQMIVDTGSSDTWLVQNGFQCVNVYLDPQPAAACKFGPAYKGSFGAKKIPNVNFNISYGDGEFVTGDFGTVDITIAGITVPQQTSALGTLAYWNGDSISSGLIGLAYPAITSEYQGSDPHKDKSSAKIQYDPLFTTMYKKGLTSAMFSMAIERNTGGYMAFGGLPPVNYTGPFASTPIQLTQLGAGGSSYAFYTITPDAISYKGAPAKNTDQYIVDSGTTLVYAPTKVAAAINRQFSPPAKVKSGLYQVDCKAKAPPVGIKIGGTVFSISAQDLILHDASGICISGVQDGGSSGPFILGDVFMTNAVVVFDVGAAQMRFAANVY